MACAGAALFHLLWGKTALDLAIFLLAGPIGFALGQFLAITLSSPIPAIGDVHLIEGLLGCALSLTIAKWLKV